jgi:hypothetical protein
MSGRPLYDMFADKPEMVGKPVKLYKRSTAGWIDAEGRAHIRYHKTDILTFFDLRADGFYYWVQINTGGWRTRSTKDRLHEFLKDYGIYQVKGEWFVQPYGLSQAMPFRDSMWLPVKWKPFWLPTWGASDRGLLERGR